MSRKTFIIISLTMIRKYDSIRYRMRNQKGETKLEMRIEKSKPEKKNLTLAE